MFRWHAARVVANRAPGGASIAAPMRSGFAWNGRWPRCVLSSVAYLGPFAAAFLVVACGARTGLDPGAASKVERDSIGCSDGVREGFVDVAAYPNIAGCGGGWSIPGVMLQNPGTAPECPSVPTFDTATPACKRRAGNDGPNPNGVGCNVADLCAEGWHVCLGAKDVAGRSPNGCESATRADDPPLFFASRQSSNGCRTCATGTLTGLDCDSMACTSGCAQSGSTSNDVFGCGNFGDSDGLRGPFVDCGPLDRTTYNECIALAGSNWSCTDDDSGSCEAFVIVHVGADHGGVLCCHD